MTANDILTFVVNLINKTKSGILSLLGKSDDAYNEYDLSLTVTDHHYGENFDPTNKKVYNGKVKIYLGNVIAAVIALFSALSFLLIIKNIFRRY